MQFLVGPPCTVPGASKELALTRIISIPDEKPPIEKVLDACVEAIIEKATVIKTPIINEQGPLRKVIIKGTAVITLKYVAAVKDQQVHAAIFHIPFESLVEWQNGPTPGSPICVNVTTEHFQVDPLDYCTLLAAMVLRFDIYNKPE